jgi:hypothetical protein
MKWKFNTLIVIFMTSSLSGFLGTYRSLAIDTPGPGCITGRIIGQTTQCPLAAVSVVLYTIKDSSIVAGTLSNTAGEFRFSMLASGEYFMVLSCDGFEQQISEPIKIQKDQAKVNLGEVFLSTARNNFAKIHLAAATDFSEPTKDKRGNRAVKRMGARSGVNKKLACTSRELFGSKAITAQTTRINHSF